MSGLFLNTGACRGWAPPNNVYAPTITYLSSIYSPAGSNTLVAIFGTNFKLYSTIKLYDLSSGFICIFLIIPVVFSNSSVDLINIKPITNNMIPIK